MNIDGWWKREDCCGWMGWMEMQNGHQRSLLIREGTHTTRSPASQLLAAVRLVRVVVAVAAAVLLLLQLLLVVVERLVVHLVLGPPAGRGACACPAP